MAYQDPYAGQYGHYQQQSYGQPQYGQQQPYGQPQYAPQQYGQYGEPAPEFNPYAPSAHAHPTYEPGPFDDGGYRDDPGHEPPQRQASQHGYSDAPPLPGLAPKSVDERSSFDPGEFTPVLEGPSEQFRRSDRSNLTPPVTKDCQELREYRKDFQGPLWRRGGGASCFGRFFCCTFMIIVFLVATILLTLVLFLRPPSISFGNVTPSASAVQLTTNGINIGMGVNISVENPNFFNVNFKKINAEASSLAFLASVPRLMELRFITLSQRGVTNYTLIGGGTTNNLVSDITVKYKITLGIQILFVTISPSISNNFVFACPLTESDLSGLLGGAGLGLTGTRREEGAEEENTRTEYQTRKGPRMEYRMRKPDEDALDLLSNTPSLLLTHIYIYMDITIMHLYR
ncbi:hypothetical protein K438DRAFT_1957874 [Mycena galopus ATCC 62051]|nr:hypothetical protein K438DRAFT_1957874 [Mycena galopus ATCC 62051]